MKISACVITKNEEKNIGNWLKYMSAIADEMIVVDTGSTDNTVLIAKNAGAKVFFFKWINDFAAAKNYAINHAKGDWIIFLDADEYFTEETIVNVRNVISNHHKNKKIGSIMCRLINIDTDRNNRIIDTMLQVRIFRNISSIRYAGKIHENLRNLHGDRVMIFSKDIEIYHTGYSANILREKSERNLLILEEKRKKEGDTDEVIVFLLDAYNSLGRYEEAIKYARKAIEKKLRLVGMDGHCHEILISAMISANYPLQEIYSVIDEAMKELPEEPVFPMEKGYILYTHGDYIQAQSYLQKGLELREIFDRRCNEGVGLTDNSRRMLHYTYEALAEINRKKGNIQLAAEFYVKGIKYYRYNVILLRGLYKIIAKEDSIEKIELLNSLYNKNNDSDFICNVLQDLTDEKLYSYYGNNAKNLKNMNLYMHSGRYDSAAVEISNSLSADYLMAIAFAKNTFQQSDLTLNVLLPNEFKEILHDKNKLSTSYSEAVSRLMKNSMLIGNDSSENPLVSIMIPTYNRPEMFEKTLISALNQTYRNIEILVNDNSTNDLTQQLIEKYLSDERLHYYRNVNAKNKEENFKPFEQQAKGSMLQWCMDDDILEAKKIEIMVQVLRDNPGITLVTSQRGIIDENDNIISSGVANILNIESTYAHYDGKELSCAMLTSIINIIGEPSAVLFRRNDLKNHYWKAECRGYERISDVVMWLELLEKGNCIIFKEPLSYYRSHQQQEGQQPEVILQSRLEWKRLIDESYKNSKILSENDYVKGLTTLYNEYNTSFFSLPQLRKAKNMGEYKKTMLSIKEKLAL